MPENPVAATHFTHADRPRQRKLKEGGPPMPTEHGDGPRQGSGADAEPSRTTTDAPSGANIIVSHRHSLHAAFERAAERVIDAAASVTSLCLYVGGFRLAYELATGVIGRG